MRIVLEVAGRRRGTDLLTVSTARALEALKRIERTGEHAFVVPFGGVARLVADGEEGPGMSKTGCFQVREPSRNETVRVGNRAKGPRT